MDRYDSVDKRLCALAEWLKSNATNTEETSNVDITSNNLYHNHVTNLYHPYANFGHNPSIVKYINKPHRERTTFTENHLEILERSFNEVKHPDTSRREKLAKEVGLPAKTIQIWFQNRRARERKFGKEKRITDHSCIQQLDSSSPVKLHGYPSKFKSECIDAVTSESNSSINTNIVKSCTTVEEIDSSKRHKKNTSPDPLRKRENKNEEFTIIHIPDVPSLTNSHKDGIIPTFTPTDSVNMTGQTTFHEMPEEIELPFEKQFLSSVENLDLDLIVKTYEVLQLSDNVDSLIQNWLCDISQEQDNDAQNSTLEENLKRFIQFSQKSLI